MQFNFGMWKIGLLVLRSPEAQVTQLPSHPTERHWLLPEGLPAKTSRCGTIRAAKELNALTGHTNWIYSIAFSPDGKILASGSVDEKIWLWNMTSGSQLRVLAGHTNTVNCVAFSPNGQFLASGSQDLTVKLWNVLTGQELACIRGHTGPVQGVAFSIDGEALASCAWDNTVLLWNTSSLVTNPIPSRSPAESLLPTPSPSAATGQNGIFGDNFSLILGLIIIVIAMLLILKFIIPRFGVIAAIPVLLVGSAFSIILLALVGKLPSTPATLLVAAIFGISAVIRVWERIFHEILDIPSKIILKICFSISMKPEISGEKGERVPKENNPQKVV